MIPKKVYISIAVWDKGRKYDFLEVSERPHQTTDTQCHWREYTDLSQVWHDASEEPQENSKIVIVDTKGEWWNIDYISDDFDGSGLYGWEFCIAHYNLKCWAYISDLLPKQFGNSEQLKGGEK